MLDQALDGAKALCNGNENCALWVLCPVNVSAADKMAAVKKRRLLEDKLLATLGLTWVETKMLMLAKNEQHYFSYSDLAQGV